MIKLNKTARLSLSLVIFVVIPALFLGFYTFSHLDSGAVMGDAKRAVLINAAVVFLCIIAIITGGLFYMALIRKEMELVHLKDDFMSRVSHELKTPLATIKLLGEMLEQGVKKEEKRQKYYRTISQESARLDRLVNNILNFSRISSGRLNFDPRNCMVNDLIVPIINNFSLSMSETGFTFNFKNISELETIYCSPDEISQALINLLENAVKYSPKPHCIEVVLQLIKNKYYLSVYDRGMGIAEQYHKMIFNQFYRITSDDTHSQKGTGIGLSVVAAIARIHGGYVDVESTEGEGSRFTLVLPKHGTLQTLKSRS